MIVHQCRQNSDEWEAMRRGLPTASALDKIVCAEMGNQYFCNSCGKEFIHKRKRCDEDDCEGEIEIRRVVKPSRSQDEYLYKLIYESLCGDSIPNPQTGFMERGHDLEHVAVAQYELMTDRDTQVVGFVTSDDRLIGASPDRFVNPNGLLECKVPSPWVQLRYLAVPGELTRDYFVQAQGQLLVCSDRDWVDLCAYSEFPGGTPMPPVIERVTRDEEFISGTNQILVEFITRLQRTRVELLAKYGDFTPKIAAAAADPMGVSPLDAEVVLTGRTEEW